MNSHGTTRGNTVKIKNTNAYTQIFITAVEIDFLSCTNFIFFPLFSFFRTRYARAPLVSRLTAQQPAG